MPQEDFTAHLWLNLAAAKGDGNAARARDIVARRLTPEQLEAAEQFARAWRPSYP